MSRLARTVVPVSAPCHAAREWPRVLLQVMRCGVLVKAGLQTVEMLGRQEFRHAVLVKAGSQRMVVSGVHP